MQHEKTVERLKLDRLKTGLKLKLFEYPIILLSAVRQAFRVWEDAQLDQVIQELQDEGFLTRHEGNGGCTRLVRVVQ
jgi:hypothetical protein